MTLTAKQERFAQAIADGMTQADAYRASYGTGKAKAETVQQNASRLMADSKVAARVKELRAALENKALWTRERSVIALADIAGSAETKANEKVAAIKELNLMHGFNAPTQVNLNGNISLIERRIVNAHN